MDSPTYRTLKLTSLGVYFYRQWPWLRLQTYRYERPVECFDSLNPVIFIRFFVYRRLRPASISPSDQPSTSSDTPTPPGCAGTPASTLGGSSPPGLGRTPRA